MRLARRRLICIICPLGCEIEAVIEDGEIRSVSGNRCRRGLSYVEEELLRPKRVLMTVVKCRNGELPVVSVKTVKPIPKEKLLEAARLLASVEVEAPVSRGDVILEDLFGSPVVATKTVRKAVFPDLR